MDERFDASRPLDPGGIYWRNQPQHCKECQIGISKRFRPSIRYMEKSRRSVVRTMLVFRSSARTTNVESAKSIGQSAYCTMSSRARRRAAALVGTSTAPPDNTNQTGNAAAGNPRQKVRCLRQDRLGGDRLTLPGLKNPNKFPVTALAAVEQRDQGARVQEQFTWHAAATPGCTRDAPQQDQLRPSAPNR